MAFDQQQIESPFKKLRKRLKKFPARPAPEQVHKLRTRARRIETALDALSPNHACRPKRLLKLLTRIRKRAGKVRDMDVLLSYLTGLRFPDSENDCFVLLTEHLGVERSREAGKLRKSIKQNGTELRRHLRQCTTEIRKIPLAPTSSNSTRKMKPVTDAITHAIETSAELTAQRRLGPANLHAYRLTIKRLLNVLEMAREEDQDPRLIQDLKEVKDAIGEWHDWQVLEQIAGKVLDHDGCKLQSLIRAAVRRKYQKALSAANGAKAHYFGGREKVSGPVPASPVLKATYGIAA